MESGLQQPEVAGFVLAGGLSSRMGTDKALLELAGRPLIEHATTKLRRTCASVSILSSNPVLAGYAPLVADMHPGCGPIGGLEAALHYSSCAWNLFLAVDMPFLPAAFLRRWIARSSGPDDFADGRIFIFEEGGRPQPGLCLIHKDVRPFLTESILDGEYKLMRAFDLAASGIACERGLATELVLRRDPIEAEVFPERGPALEGDHTTMTAAQLASRHLWFANLNTPDDLTEAERQSAALDD